MNFIRDSFKYGLKNFLKLLVFVLPVALFFGFIRPFSTINFFANYKTLKPTNYWDMFDAILPINWISILLLIVAVVLLVITICLVLAGEEYHLRSGKFSFAKPFSRFNYYFFAVLDLTLIFLLVFTVLAFLMPAVCYFVHYMLSGLGNFPTNTTYFISIVLYLIGYSIIFMFLTILIIAVNLISLNGYTIKSALSNTLNLLEGHFFKSFMALISPYVLIIPIAYYARNLGVWFNVIATILIACQLIFYFSLSMVSYFNLTKTQRKDNPTGYFIKGAK